MYVWTFIHSREEKHRDTHASESSNKGQLRDEEGDY